MGYHGSITRIRHVAEKIAEDVHANVVRGGDNTFFLVSVQAPDDYARGHVPGAVNIPFRELAEEKSLTLFPRGKKIVFTCDDGHRSMAAALFLNQLGYEPYDRRE